VGSFLYFSFEPVIDALSMEEMPAYWDLSYRDSLLKFFKTYHTLILPKLIHPLIIVFVFDQGNKGV
jgi:hypothetical protein